MQTHSKRCFTRTAMTSSAGVTTLLVLLRLGVSVDPAAAQDTMRIRWDDLQKQGKLVGGVVTPPESGTTDYQLKVENTQQPARHVTVLSIDQPSVKGPRYSFSGQVRYENVDGAGYLELWNYFPGGGQYFSRTLGEHGAMMKLTGTSGWRQFVLPFDATGAPPPVKLVINVVLPGRGIVYLGPLQLGDQQGAGAFPEGGATPNRLLPLVGSIVGGIGALIGTLTSMGRARRFVIASAAALVMLGVLLFAAGVAGFVWPRAYSSGSPLLLIFGFLTSLVPLSLLPVIRKRYESAELRAMRAQDLA